MMNALYTNRMCWTVRKTKLLREGGVEPSHMVSATAGKPVRGRHSGNAGERELS